METKHVPEWHFDVQFSGLSDEYAGVCRFDLTVYEDDLSFDLPPVFIAGKELKKCGVIIREYLKEKDLRAVSWQTEYRTGGNADADRIDCRLERQADTELFLLKADAPSFKDTWEMDLSGEDLRGLADYMKDPY